MLISTLTIKGESYMGKLSYSKKGEIKMQIINSPNAKYQSKTFLLSLVTTTINKIYLVATTLS
jgi:hypothetical protein